MTRRCRAELLPGARVRDAVLVVGGAAMTGLAAQIVVPVPGSPVPITGQTFGVLLVGAGLGWRRGALSMVLYLVAGTAGVPWFQNGTSGWLGSTGGLPDRLRRGRGPRRGPGRAR